MNARWLAAATYDRWQMYQGQPQKYGTNFIYDGREHRLWEVLPDTTDEEAAMSRSHTRCAYGAAPRSGSCE